LPKQKGQARGGFLFSLSLPPKVLHLLSWLLPDPVVPERLGKWPSNPPHKAFLPLLSANRQALRLTSRILDEKIAVLLDYQILCGTGTQIGLESGITEDKPQLLSQQAAGRIGLSYEEIYTSLLALVLGFSDSAGISEESQPDGLPGECTVAGCEEGR
jgi:hypothetical protein